MKINFFTLVFAIIFILYMVIMDTSHMEQASLTEHQRLMNQHFQSAVDDGAHKLVTSEKEELRVHKEAAAEAFLLSLYSSLGILEQPDKQELLRAYLPVFAVTEESGFYVLYSDEYKDSSGNTCVIKRWSEKIHYVYEDEDFIYNFSLGDMITIYDKNSLLEEESIQVFTLDFHEAATGEQYKKLRTKYPNHFMLKKESYELKKRETVIGLLEQYLNYYVNEHNLIAKQYGILYEFSMPVVDESEWVRSVNGPGMLIIFQGYPYRGTKNTFNQFSFVGAEVNKRNVLYLEKVDYYYRYHTRYCTEYEQKEQALVCYTKEEAAKHGAYACSFCFPNTGVKKYREKK